MTDATFQTDDTEVWAFDDEKLTLYALDNDNAWLAAEDPVYTRQFR